MQDFDIYCASNCIIFKKGTPTLGALHSLRVWRRLYLGNDLGDVDLRSEVSDHAKARPGDRAIFDLYRYFFPVPFIKANQGFIPCFLQYFYRFIIVPVNLRRMMRIGT
jgi:hypothetical protein